MSELHTKLEEKVDLLTQKLINVKNDINALKNKLDVWRNEANNMIKDVKQSYANLDEDFIRLANYIKKLFTPIPPLPDDLMKRINNIKSVPMKKTEKKEVSDSVKITLPIPNTDEDDGLVNTSIPLYPVYPEVSTIDSPNPPICGKCGNRMIMDIATLNKIDWWCPKCCSEDPNSPLYEKPSTIISMEELRKNAEKIR